MLKSASQSDSAAQDQLLTSEVTPPAEEPVSENDVYSFLKWWLLAESPILFAFIIFGAARAEVPEKAPPPWIDTVLLVMAIVIMVVAFVLCFRRWLRLRLACCLAARATRQAREDPSVAVV